MTGQWDALAADALDDNPFFDRQVVAASRDCLSKRGSDRVLALHLRSSRKLIGLLPYRSVKPAGYARSNLNIYQSDGVPLISGEHAETAIDGFLKFAAEGVGAPRRWVLPHVQLDGRFATLMRRKAVAHGMSVIDARSYDRPMLTRRAGDFKTHVRDVIGKKRAKSLQKNLERLAQQGEVRFERVSDPRTVARRLEDFLQIEHSGWKGARGTSFLAKHEDATYARQAFAGTAGGFTSVDSLLLDGQPIAVSINIGTGDTLFTPKCAYDETYRKFSPGLILEYLILEAFYKGRHHWMNSATTGGGHVITGLWDGTIPMGTLVVGPTGMMTRSLAWAEDAELRARQFAKRLMRRG